MPDADLKHAPKVAETAPYGYCPACGAVGKSRERRPNGFDRCENGCKYRSDEALTPETET